MAEPSDPEQQPLREASSDEYRLRSYQSVDKPPRTPKLMCPTEKDQEEGVISEVTMPTGYFLRHDGRIIHQLDPTRTVHKIVTYDPEVVLGWDTLLNFSLSVFTKPIILQTLGQSALIGVCSAVLILSVKSGPTLKTKQLNYLVNFMMAFLAFITGIFVNSSFIRWQTVVQHLGTLFRSIKALNNDLQALGCPDETRRRIKRWGILSVWLLAYESPENWERTDWDKKFATIQSFGYVTDKEKDFLIKTGAKAGIPWSWCTMTIKELTQKDMLPSTATPAFVMLLNNIDSAETSIESIDRMCLLQMPYQYVHMLAWLIHAFNIVNAIRCGIEIGIVIAQFRYQGGGMPSAQQGQSLFTYSLIMMLAPTIYQAFLTIALDIAIPFGNGDTDMPIVYMIDRFSKELLDIEAAKEVMYKQLSGSETTAA